MEKKLTNSGPLMEPADKHSIYTIKHIRARQRKGGCYVLGRVLLCLVRQATQEASHHKQACDDAIFDIFRAYEVPWNPLTRLCHPLLPLHRPWSVLWDDQERPLLLV
jgi:hypothetical protein